MSLDLERLRQKLEQLKNPGASRTRRPLWKPDKDGAESVVRLIQYPYGDDPFVELWFHYGVGTGPNSNFLCPHLNYGKSCPVCDFAKSLIKSGDEQDKELAKKLFAKQRVFAVVIDRADAEPTPKFWGFGKTVYQKLLTDLTDVDVGNFMDVEKGLDAKISYEKATGQAFPKTEVRFVRRESPLFDDQAKVQKLISKIPKIEEVYQPLTKSQIQEQLTTWLEFSEEDAEEVSKEVVKTGKPVEDELEDTLGGNSVEDIDAAFEEALG